MEISTDAVMPSQFRGGQERCPRGVRDLMAAIMADAIETLRKYRGVREPIARRLHSDALTWFEGAEAKITFAAACHALDLDPDVIREGIRRDERSARMT